MLTGHLACVRCSSALRRVRASNTRAADLQLCHACCSSLHPFNPVQRINSSHLASTGLSCQRRIQHRMAAHRRQCSPALRLAGFHLQLNLQLSALSQFVRGALEVQQQGRGAQVERLGARLERRSSTRRLQAHPVIPSDLNLFEDRLDNFGGRPEQHWAAAQHGRAPRAFPHLS